MKRTVIINNQILCTKCNTLKDVLYFYKRPEHNSYRSVCNSCSKGYMRSTKVRVEEANQLIKENLKRCSKCLDIKHIDSFGIDNFTKFKLTSWCKSCIKDKTQRTQKKDSLQQKYKLSLDDYKNLIISQNGKCKICNQVLDLQNPKSVHVDHCHTTLTVRGILCRHCNMGLGFFQDNITFLSEAINYLKQSTIQHNG